MYKFNSIFRYNRLLLRTMLLMLMLFVGPLHAQVLYACARIEKTSGLVMQNTSDMAKHETSLCNTHQSCVNTDCDSMFDSNQGQCCGESPTLTINPDLHENIPAINLAEIESDADPPQAIVTTLGHYLPGQTFATLVVLPRINSGQYGSNTYLITQRLRI